MKRSGGIRRERLLKIVARMSHPDPWYVEFSRDVWLGLWKSALDRLRRYNDRTLVHDMLDIDWPVPVEIARQLLDLKGPAHRPPAIEYDEEDVVFFVRGAILDGHKFPASDGSNEGDSAFDVVAREIGCSTSTVAAYYRKCPRELRDEIKRSMEEDASKLPEEGLPLGIFDWDDEGYQSMLIDNLIRNLEEGKRDSWSSKGLLVLLVAGKR